MNLDRESRPDYRQAWAGSRAERIDKNHEEVSMRSYILPIAMLLWLMLAQTEPAWAVSGLIVRCDVAGAAVHLNGSYQGTCPGKFTPSSGSYTLRISKGIDTDTEWAYSQQINLTDGEITKVEATLTKYYTEAHAQRQRAAEQARREAAARAEQERLAAEQNAERERQAQAKREEAEKQAQIRAFPKERAKRERRAEQLSEEFASIPGGCFQMGDRFGEGSDDEKPPHEVCVEDFRLGKYEVTQWQWQQVMGENPSQYQYCGGDCPVEMVSFVQVQAFIAELNRQTGRHYRLPTEAEWEYACRSGGKDQRYCGGSDVDALAWYGYNSGDKTHAVGGKAANGLGLYDMTGNVDEWTCSEYEEKYAGGEKKCSGNNDTTGLRVARGGSWIPVPADVRSAGRSGFYPTGSSQAQGFRLAQD